MKSSEVIWLVQTSSISFTVLLTLWIRDCPFFFYPYILCEHVVMPFISVGKIDMGKTRLNFWDLGGQEELQSLWDKVKYNNSRFEWCTHLCAWFYIKGCQHHLVVLCFCSSGPLMSSVSTSCFQMPALSFFLCGFVLFFQPVIDHYFWTSFERGLFD